MALWAEPRWRSAVIDWATERLLERGRSIAGDVEQPHIRPWSTVFRLPTDGGNAWCKATGPGTAHEVRLLPAFAEWGVSHVVVPLAADPERSWLLLEDGGLTLRQARADGRGDTDLGTWEAILSAHAALQRSVEGRADELLGLGVPDGRPGTLPATFERLVSDDAVWDRVVARDRAETDAARSRLRALATWVAARAAELARTGIAATIQHDDLHGGNVFIDAGGVRFFDWGDAVVAHPFRTLVTTLDSVADRLGFDSDGPELGRLRDAYLEAWTDVLPRAGLDEALELALDLGRIGKAAAWQRALDGLEPTEMGEHAGAPALWLADLVERLDRRRHRRG
jgi:phosphotransferase family enzyme